eukprot:scaffold57175_cov14-Prasinocladus_malaysianus.AAC.1
MARMPHLKILRSPQKETTTIRPTDPTRHINIEPQALILTACRNSSVDKPPFYRRLSIQFNSIQFKKKTRPLNSSVRIARAAGDGPLIIAALALFRDAEVAIKFQYQHSEQSKQQDDEIKMNCRTMSVPPDSARA